MKSLSESDSDPDDVFRPRKTAAGEKSDTSNSKDVSTFSCKFCKVLFTRKNNCTRHESICSVNPNANPPRFHCPHCKIPFRRKQALSNHLKKCSTETPKPHQSKSKNPCLIQGCAAEFHYKVQLIDHLSVVHQNEIKVKDKVSKTFSSIEEFNAWKEKEEESSFSCFTARKGQALSSTRHYYCQHDGSKKLHSKRLSSRCNKKGRVKVGHYCMAKMKVTINDSKVVQVDYYPTHSHANRQEDMLHHPLPAAMSKFIDEKLAENIPPTIVHELVKERFLPKDNLEVHETRAGTLKKKTILERGRRRRMKRRLDQDDAKSVFLLAHKLILKDNSVLIYKPYGEKLVHGPEEIDHLPNSKDLFMFAFQTERQLDLMKRHSSKIVIVDETHGTNQYKYQLLTAMVIDENRRGWPVAHLITSKSDADTLQFFFKTLHSRLNNEVSINCVITDDDPALINAMNAGFSEKLKHILCKWHVFKNFKENLRSKVPYDLFDTMLSEIKVIMNTENESLFLRLNLFLRLKDAFQSKYKNNPDASKYMSYLEQHYWRRVEKWAMCYRNFPHGDVNTTGHIESFHNRLKKEYLKRKVNKRLDDLINVLYSIEWDDHCARLRESTIGFSVQPQDIFERHQRGILMEDNMIVEQTLERLWEVKSADTDCCKTYFVERCKESCNFEMCFSKCTKAECHGLCSHLFSCSCPDLHPLCKHIHKIQSYLTRGEPFVPVEENFYNFETDKSNEELNIDYESTGETSTTHNRKIKNAIEQLTSNISLLQQFLNAAQVNAVPEHSIIYVNTVLSDLMRGLEPERFQKKAEEVQTIPSMDPVVSFSPNEKLKTQMSQLASFKRPPKRKRKEDLSVLAAKKQAAIKGLLNCLFTPPITYVMDPSDCVLQCGEERISLIHLKSLELHLPDEEEEFLMKRDAIFRSGWLYCTIINAFMFKLSEKHENIFTLSLDHASRASMKQSNADFFSKYKETLKSKDIILSPVNFEDHWLILAIFIKEGEIRYYDPSLQVPLSSKCVALLTQMISDLKTIFSSSKWKIKVVRKPKQPEALSYGPCICQYAAETVNPCLTLPSSYEVRKYIYGVIVGKCLTRSNFAVEQCDKCGVHYSDDCHIQSWICCSSCEQWFHESCADRRVCDEGKPFVCP